MTKARSFTLLEITLAAAVLAIVSFALTWQVRGMVQSHRFGKSVDRFYTDLQRAQLTALASLGDFEIEFTGSLGNYTYEITTSEPLKGLTKSKVKLECVDTIEGLGKLPHTLHLYFTGRIDPQTDLTFRYKGEKRTLHLDKLPTLSLTSH